MSNFFQSLDILLKHKESIAGGSLLVLGLYELSNRFESLKLAFIAKSDLSITLLETEITSLNKSVQSLKDANLDLKNIISDISTKNSSSIFDPVINFFKSFYYLPDEAKAYLTLFFIGLLSTFILMYFFQQTRLFQFWTVVTEGVAASYSFVASKVVNQEKTVAQQITDLAVDLASCNAKLDQISPEISSSASAIQNSIISSSTRSLEFIRSSNEFLVGSLSEKDTIMKSFLADLFDKNVRLSEVQTDVLVDSIGGIVQRSGNNSVDNITGALRDVVSFLASSNQSGVNTILDQLANNTGDISTVPMILNDSMSLALPRLEDLSSTAVQSFSTIASQLAIGHSSSSMTLLEPCPIVTEVGLDILSMISQL